TTPSAAAPATATTTSATRKRVVGAEIAAATDASGVSAALSSNPSRTSERPTAPRLAFVPRQRRTTATRMTSSNRPGSATPPTEAAPPAAASVSTRGRRSPENRRCQPHAFAPYASRKSSPASTTSQTLACRIGQPEEAKWRAVRPAAARASTNEATPVARRTVRDRAVSRTHPAAALTELPDRHARPRAEALARGAGRARPAAPAACRSGRARRHGRRSGRPGGRACRAPVRERPDGDVDLQPMVRDELVEVALPVGDETDLEPVRPQLFQRRDRVLVELEVLVPLPFAHHRGRALAAAAPRAAHALHDRLGERDPDLLVVLELGVLRHLLDRSQPRVLVARRVELEAVALPEVPVPLRPELEPGAEEREVDVEQDRAQQPRQDTCPVTPNSRGNQGFPRAESGCPDLNWGPLRPERSALPGCATPRARTE